MKFILDIVVYLFSVVGGVVSILTIYKWLSPYKKIGWKQVEKGILHLKEQLIKDNYIPSMIVGVGRGGAVVGALLSGCLGHIPVLVIDRVYDWSEDGRKEKLFENIKINKNLEKVLFVAGELHTGGTAKTFISYFNKIGALQVKFLTFTKEKYPALVPDYYFIENDNPELHLPWMITKEYKRDSLKKC
jgi:hypoxanthine phosphoribosyltransferase